MGEKELSSRDNPAVKQYVLLSSSRKERREKRLFVTEGLKLTREAYQAGCVPEELFVTEAALDRDFEAIQEIAVKSAHFYRITPGVADKLAQSVSPQGLFGVFHMLDNEAQPVKIGSNGKFILLSSLQDPGNLGAILRTAAAFGIDGVFLSDDCPDLYSPKVLRATMGGVFKVHIETTDNLCGTIARLRENGVEVYAAALRADAASPTCASLSKGGCAVVVGNEGGGLSDEVIEACARTIAIPMEPDSESLNAAMAAGIFMWEMYRS